MWGLQLYSRDINPHMKHFKLSYAARMITRWKQLMEDHHLHSTSYQIMNISQKKKMTEGIHVQMRILCHLRQLGSNRQESKPPTAPLITSSLSHFHPLDHKISPHTRFLNADLNHSNLNPRYHFINFRFISIN